MPPKSNPHSAIPDNGDQPSAAERVALWILVAVLIASTGGALAAAFLYPVHFLPLGITAGVSGVLGTFFIGVLTRNLMHAFGVFCFLTGAVLGWAGNAADGWQAWALNIAGATFTITSILIEYKAVSGKKAPVNS